MRCPVCNADNAQGPLCRRCRADLSLLFRLEAQQRHLLSEARQALRIGDSGRALHLVTRALAQRNDNEAQQLVAGCRLWRRDFAGAWRTYRALEPSAEP